MWLTIFLLDSVVREEETDGQRGQVPEEPRGRVRAPLGFQHGRPTMLFHEASQLKGNPQINALHVSSVQGQRALEEEQRLETWERERYLQRAHTR